MALAAGFRKIIPKLFLQEKSMTIFGVGPWLAFVGIISAATVIFCDFYYGARIALPVVASKYTRPIGIVFAIIGGIFWAVALMQILKGRSRKKLITAGPFQYTRNPMYASFILFVIPGTALFLNNLLFLLVSTLVFIAFKRFIAREEAYLRKEYGDIYARYVKNVPQLIPRPRKGRRT